MPIRSGAVLDILDRCAKDFAFPMLDNGYIYLAATRLALFRSEADWALVIETFGFSPRDETPSIAVQTYASTLHNRNPPGNYVSRKAYDGYLLANSNNESRFFWPMTGQGFHDPDDNMLVAPTVTSVQLRGSRVGLPSAADLSTLGIVPEHPPRLQIFELCRYLAGTKRSAVLALPSEQRVSVAPSHSLILQLDEWRHPDLAAGERPSEIETFRHLARVLGSGDVSLYQPTVPPNTHWRHWPEGGRL